MVSSSYKLSTVSGISVKNLSYSYRPRVAACWSDNWYLSPWVLFGGCVLVDDRLQVCYFSRLPVLLCSHCVSGELPCLGQPCFCFFLPDAFFCFDGFSLLHSVWAVNVSWWGFLVSCLCIVKLTLTCFTVFIKFRTF